MKCEECTIDNFISCLTASKNGHLECLIYARSKKQPWSKLVDIGLPKKRRVYATELAAKFGHINCLRYARENGCPWISRLLEVAANNKQVECFKYAYENGCKLPKINICDIAAENGCLELLKYAHAKGFSFASARIRDIATRNGHLDCLIYARENGAVWETKTCVIAAANNHLNCLRYAHENGCPWDEETCDFAACWGSIECLTYAFENGCGWDEKTAYFAVLYDRLECFKFICENGCNWDVSVCVNAAIDNDNADFLSYICSQLSDTVDNVLEQESIQEYKTCTCIVCFDKIVQIKFLPCNHKICCNECSVRLIPFNKCAMCRAEIKKREAMTIEDLQKLEDSNKNTSF